MIDGRPRHILFVDHTARLGGGELALLDLVRHLDPRRYRPSVLLLSDGPLHGKLQQAGIETHILSLSDRVVNARKDSLGGRSLLRILDVAAVLKYVGHITQFIRRGHVDLLHANSLKADLIGGLAGRLAGIPVIWHVRDRIDSDYLPARVAFAFRWLCRAVPTAVIANSTATLETLRLPPTRPTRVIPSGVNLEEFTGAPHWPPQSRDESTRVIGIVGRISPWKGQHVFVHAAAELRDRFPDVRFQIIGAPLFEERAYELELRDLVRSSGLENRVQFTGFRDDVPQLMANMDVLVHASITAEPFGQVVAQGMAAGKPVVATAGGGVLDLVKNEVTGFLVPMGDSHAMAQAIGRLLDDPGSAREMGDRGRERIRDSFTIQHATSSLMHFYDCLLSRRFMDPVATDGRKVVQ